MDKDEWFNASFLDFVNMWTAIIIIKGAEGSQCDQWVYWCFCEGGE